MSDSEHTGGDSAETLTAAPAEIVGVDAQDELVEEALAPSAEVVDDFGAYVRMTISKIRNGESGVGPVVLGLIAIVIFFQLEQPLFLHAANLGNLFVLAAVYVMYGLAQMFALILSEIDLAVGFTAGVGAFVFAELNAAPVSWPWWLAVIASLFAVSVFGFLQGLLVSRLRLPSFIVTLGGFLFMEGMLLEVPGFDPAANGGVLELNGNTPVYKLASSNMSPALGWIVLVVLIAVFAAFSLYRAANTRRHGLVAPPLGVIVVRIVAAAIVGAVIVAILNVNRGSAVAPLRGVPWVIPFVLLVVVLWTFVLQRTKLGRYIYAVGANPEAARRAGINVKMIQTTVFVLASFGAGLAGLVYASNLSSIATDYDGGTIVLFSVAAAVIGGTSLFGGRGKPVHSLLGGLIIAVVVNGLALMSVNAAVTDMATAAVLLSAVILDAVVRRRASTLAR